LGGFLRNGGEITNSIKRKLKEMMASAECNIVCDVLMKERPSISYYDVDVLARCSNRHMPPTVRAIMVSFEIHCILIDQWAMCDFMFSNLLRTISLFEDDLTSFGGCDFTGFNDSIAKTWGFTSPRVMFNENKARKTVKCQFFVINFLSPYNNIISENTLVELGVVSSTVHLKITYHNDQDNVMSVPADV